MTDRELLELAAKAAGYALKWGETYIVGDDEVDCTDLSYVVSGQPDEADWLWSPLEDDGDALRLAVNLGIQIRQYPIYDTPRFAALACEAKWSSDAERQVGAEALVNYEGDPYAATRRAIVRAAAEIGKGSQ